MKIAAFTDAQGPGLGVVDGDEIAVIARGDAGGALLDMIEAGPNGLTAGQTALDSAPRVALASVRLDPPVVSRQRALICVGKNYHAHAREFVDSGFDTTGSEAIPQAPVIFAKLGTSLVGDGIDIRSDLDLTRTVDYEGELALVIGRRAHKVSKASAHEVIFGYTIANDVTSRALQKKHGQWLVGKSLDSFGPLGPWIVTADEMRDIATREIVTTVNGERRQHARLSDMIFDIPTLIETLSATMTLNPGDIVATGTPAGVGIGFDPPRYLRPGDHVEVSISGIGTLRNPVV